MILMKRVPAIILITVIVLSALLVGCTPAEVPATVKPVNQKPAVTAVNGPAELIPGAEGEFSCIAYDPDGDIVAYSWSATQGTFKGQGEKVIFIAPDNTGTCMITVNVRDNGGASAVGVKEIRVTETAGPSTADKPLVLNIKLGSAEPATAKARVRIWFSALVDSTVEGAGGGKLTYTWTPSGGKLQGKGLSEGAATKVAWIAPGVKDNYQLELTVKDENGNTGRGIVYFEVFCCGN